MARNSGKALLGFLQEGAKQEIRSLPYSPEQERGRVGKHPLYGVRVGVRLEGWPGGCSPLWCWVLRHAQHAVFLPTPSFCSWLFRNGSWDFCLLVQNLSQLHMHCYFYSHKISLYFLAPRIGASRCKHCSMHPKGVRSQAWLMINHRPLKATFKGISGLMISLTIMKLRRGRFWPFRC